MERAGIATVSFSVLPDITSQLGAPRAVVTPHGLGQPIGGAHDRDQHLAWLRHALSLVTRTDVPVIEQVHLDAV
jgi:hypothetical protein